VIRLSQCRWHRGRIVETGEAAKRTKEYINHDRIYPPPIEAGIDALLEAAEPGFKPIKS